MIALSNVIKVTNTPFQKLSLKNGAPCIKGLDGKDGVDGKTPYIQGGYWYIDGVSTGVKAVGVDGKDGVDGYTPQKGIDYFKEEELNFINTKSQIHNVAELPQTLDGRSNYDLWRISKFEGLIVQLEENIQNPSILYFVDELPEVGKVTEDGGTVYGYANLGDGFVYVYTPSGEWATQFKTLEIMPSVFFSAEDFLESGLNMGFVVHSETKIYALDAKSAKSLPDTTISPSYVEITSDGGIKNVSELPKMAEDGLYKIAIHKGSVASLHSGMPDGIHIDRTPMFVYFVDELPEVGLPTVEVDADGPDVWHWYVNLTDGYWYLYDDQWIPVNAEIHDVLFYSKEAFLESGADGCILINEVSEYVFLAKNNTFQLISSNEPYVQKREVEEAVSVIEAELETKEEKYELWNDITLTEDVEKISLSAKDNGELYHGFRKMHIAIFGKLTPNVSTRLRATLGANHGGINSFFLWGSSATYTYADDVQGYAWFATIERISNNMVITDCASKFVNNASADSSANSHHYVLYNRRRAADYEFVPSSFNIYTAETPTNFLAGTNIKVWGIK